MFKVAPVICVHRACTERAPQWGAERL